MSWYGITGTVIGSGIVIFTTLWLIVLVWETFLPKTTIEKTVLDSIFAGLALKIVDWLI